MKPMASAPWRKALRGQSVPPLATGSLPPAEMGEPHTGTPSAGRKGKRRAAKRRRG